MSELLDIKSIALNLDVSRQTIYNHIQKNDKELTGHIRKVQGITYLNEEGIYIIKESMGLIEKPVVNEQFGIEEIAKMVSDEITLSMDSKLEEVKEESSKDYQDLKNEMEELKEQNKLLIDMIQEQNNKTFWDRFKKK